MCNYWAFCDLGKKRMLLVLLEEEEEKKNRIFQG